MIHKGRRFTVSALCVATVLLNACAPTVTSYSLVSLYNDTDFKPYSGAGPATLNGQAFLKTVGGDVKTCAGNQVLLVPATAYMDEVIVHTRAGQTLTNKDPRATQFTRVGTCDASGKFVFNQIPPRKWYIVVKVTWGIPTEYGIDSQGGEMMQAVDLKPGVNETILTDKDLNK